MNEIENFPLTSMNIKEEQVAKMKELFPEVFTEGSKIDWDKLRLTLGELVDVGKERYGMNWHGKADCFKTIQQPSVATLVPARDESVNFDTTENLFIEGDNLEVLKLLQKSYIGKIKMIYIDPPYNTGNDFIYPDNYAESLDTYLAYTGQKDAEGRKFSTNVETDGRFHSKWMNMMYPRLFLAKNLLCEDGVIFISIDEKERSNLNSLCNEIFGEENYISNIVWEKRFTRSNNAKMFTTLTENILLYRKTSKLEVLKEPRSEKANSIYSNPDNDARGPWTSVSYVNPATKTQRPNLVYDIINPYTNQKITHPTNAWKYEYKTHLKHLEDNRLFWGLDNENTFPRLKVFLDEMNGGMVPVDLWKHLETGTTDQGSKELESLFNTKVFDFPKPCSLIKRMISLLDDDLYPLIVLDFFAGSATTAQSVIEHSVSSKIKINFICVQLPELTDSSSTAFNAGYKNIADIGKERIRRVIKKVSDDNDKKKQKSVNAPGIFKEEVSDIPNIDLGFRVFKLSPSNFDTWNADVEKKPEVIQEQMFRHIDHISPEAGQEAILYELLLKSGFQLTTKIEKLEIEGKQVFSVQDGAMLICLEKELTNELIKSMAEMKPARVICLDEGFQNNDQLKANAVLIMKSNNVIKFQTV